MHPTKCRERGGEHMGVKRKWVIRGWVIRHGVIRGGSFDHGGQMTSGSFDMGSFDQWGQMVGGVKRLVGNTPRWVNQNGGH